MLVARDDSAFGRVMVVTSIGEMLGFPGSPAWIDSRSTPQRRGKFQGLYNLFMSCGRAVGPLIGGIVLDYASYRELFSLAAGLIIIFAVILWAMNKRRVLMMTK